MEINSTMEQKIHNFYDKKILTCLQVNYVIVF